MASSRKSTASSSCTTHYARLCTTQLTKLASNPTGCPSPIPLRIARRHVTPSGTSPSRLRQPLTRTTHELLERLLQPRRQRSNPPFIKRKLSSWHLKHTHHRNPPSHPPGPSHSSHPPKQPAGARNFQITGTGIGAKRPSGVLPRFTRRELGMSSLPVCHPPTVLRRTS